MRLRFLGTGTSFGVPVIGCDCETCTSDDPRDRRTRHAAVLETEDAGTRVLVDAPPELRLQLVGAAIDRVDAVWFTHCHADHVHGIDDLRAFTARLDEPLPAFAGERCAETLRRRFGYVFDPHYRPPRGTTKPNVRLGTLEVGRTVEVGPISMLPVPVPHGRGTVFGFRAGPLGYLTDASAVPDTARELLEDIDVLVINALWFGKPHPTHLTVEQAVRVADELGARVSYLTHLSHRVSHGELLERLPPAVRPAYDGLVIDI